METIIKIGIITMLCKASLLKNIVFIFIGIAFKNHKFLPSREIALAEIGEVHDIKQKTSVLSPMMYSFTLLIPRVPSILGRLRLKIRIKNTIIITGPIAVFNM